MNKIQEIIVVEGRHDSARLKQFFDCDTIETGGDQMSEQTLARIAQAAKSRGVIIFTDPDYPGEHIRRQINERIDGCKNAFIDKKKARTDKKVGVEHAAREDLEAALASCVTFTKNRESISWDEFLDLGLMGNKERRIALMERLGTGPCNAKTCFHRLNQMGIDAAKVKEVLHD